MSFVKALNVFTYAHLSQSVEWFNEPEQSSWLGSNYRFSSPTPTAHSAPLENASLCEALVIRKVAVEINLVAHSAAFMKTSSAWVWTPASLRYPRSPSVAHRYEQ
jgi:hypothetical protein